MDPATIIGLLLAFGAMFTMLFMEGASLSSILLPAPMIIVFFGTIAVGIASGTIKDMLAAFKALPQAFRGKIGNPRDLVEQLVHFAEVARRDGLLALEAEVAKAKDPLVARALQAMADGVDADDLRDMLEDDIDTQEREKSVASKWFATLGGYAPTVGIIGTVVSLTDVLEICPNPTSWAHDRRRFRCDPLGTGLGELHLASIGARLGRLAELESEQLNLAVEGLMAIQSGTPALVLREKLEGMLPADSAKASGSKDSIRLAEQDFEEAA